MLRRRLVLVLVCAAVAGVSVAQEEPVSLSLDVQGQAMVPLRSAAERYTIGGGGVLSALLDFDGPAYGRGGIGYTVFPTAATGTPPTNFITARVGAGTRLDIDDSIDIRLGILGGAYLVIRDDLVTGYPSLGAEFSLSFNLSPGFSLGLGAGYDYHVGSISVDNGFSDQSAAEGLAVSLSARFVPGAAPAGPAPMRRPRIEIRPPEFDRVFPVFYRYYNDNPLGQVGFVNNESEQISNVKVSFFVNQYMDAPKVGATFESIEPGEEVTAPLLGLFTESILDVTEGTSVTAEVIVEYEVGEDQLTANLTETLPILNRNNMTWDDDRRAAAFVTPNDPTVNRFSRNIASAIRSEGTTEVNEKLRVAMAIFEALRLYGMEYQIDPNSSYIELSENESALDFLQFPQQTLDFRSGDCDDLSILYAALLQSVGIRSAFVTIPGHLYTAFALDMDQEEAENTFATTRDLVYVDGEAWVPLEITLLQENFLAAWSTGAKQWRENRAADAARMYPIEDAWTIYQPTGFASQPLDIRIPQTTEVVPQYTDVLGSFVRREIAPQVAELEERIEASNGNPRLVNRLGTVYARYGLYEEAQEQFLRAVAEREYRPALINLGNLAYLRDELDNALLYYNRAYESRDDDPLVLISMARVHFEREEYPPATEKYREAELLDPDLAERYGYIVSQNRDDGRASSAQQRNEVIWGEE